MRRLYTLGLAAVIAAAGLPADAAKYLRQNADGTASWVNTRDDTVTPAGEHVFVVPFANIADAATRYLTIPFAGRLKEASVVIDGTIASASEIIEFYISAPASDGCVLAEGCGTFDQFTPVTPAIAEAATGDYELLIGLGYASTGQRSVVTWPVNSNTSLEFSANDIIAIHTLGDSTSGVSDDTVITIIVH